MRLLIGLGNPGPGYAKNKHNIGFMAADSLVRRHNLSPWKKAFQGEASEGRIGAHKVLVIKPGTFMNRSGQAVGEALRFYKLSPEDVAVFHDEIDLAPAKLRVKLGGGAGGHNGIRSIDAHIGNDFWRIRMGVGHPGHKDLVHGYVLSDFAKAEMAWVESLCDAVADELPRFLDGDFEGYMSRVAHLVDPLRPKPQKEKPKDLDQDGL